MIGNSAQSQEHDAREQTQAKQGKDERQQRDFLSPKRCRSAMDSIDRGRANSNFGASR
jgi:hypothetical protein